MLDSKTATQALEKLIVPDWTKSVTQAVKKLNLKPETRALIARAARRHLNLSEAFSLDDGWDEGPRGTYTVYPAEQLEILKATFPKLAPEIERAWEELRFTPYTRGYSRKSFRAPGHGVMHDIRTNWCSLMFSGLSGLNQDVEWLAAWAPYLANSPLAPYSANLCVPPLLIAAINAGGPKGEAVLETLRRSASGTHEIGMMGQHVVRSLLGCNRHEAWEFVEKMLLAAQREEGLRQSILESVDEAHPEAFRRMLRLIVEENLVRFSSVVRAIDVWFGFMYDAMSTKHAESLIETLLTAFEGPEQREKLLAAKDPEHAYLALWSIAFEDAPTAIARASKVLKEDSDPDKRFAAAHLIAQTGLPDGADVLQEAIGDQDLRVAARAFYGWAALEGVGTYSSEQPKETGNKALKELRKLLDRIEGKEATFKPKAFSWTCLSLSASDVLANIIQVSSPQDVESLSPQLPRMKPETRAKFAHALWGIRDRYSVDYAAHAKTRQLSPAAHTMLVDLLGDPAQQVRTIAFSSLKHQQLNAMEATKLEELLDRSASDLRTGALERLITLKDRELLESAGRLLAGSVKQRSAGLELLRLMVDQDRSQSRALARVRQSRSEFNGRVAFGIRG